MSGMIDQLADIAQEAARAVGPALLEAFDDPGPVQTKHDFHDVVTVHDKAAEKKIRSILFERTPDSYMLGEEEGCILNSKGSPATPGSNDIIWLVDPIDGTSNFASGLEKWCVSIAAARGDDVLAGVIYQPTRDLMYRADSSGSYKNGTAIRVRDLPLHESVAVAEFPNSKLRDKEGAGRAYMHLISQVKSVRKHGTTALDLAEVADGTMIGNFALGTQPWDVSAGIALVLGAGGHYVGIRDDRTRDESRRWDCASYCAGASREAVELFMDVIGHVEAQPFATDFLSQNGQP